MVCHVMCYVMLCYVMLCHDMSCYVMCYVWYHVCLQQRMMVVFDAYVCMCVCLGEVRPWMQSMLVSLRPTFLAKVVPACLC